MGDWTPEPWELGVDKTNVFRTDEQDNTLAQHIGTFVRPRDAARAVASVNALAGVPNPEGVGELLREAREAHRIMLGLANSHIDSGDPDIGEAWERRAGGIEKALRACGIETEEGS